MSSPGGSGSWQVDCSTEVTRQLYDIQRIASRQGRGPQVDVAIVRIWHRLHSDPEAFGEPIYNLPALHLQLRHAIILPLAVDFAVHRDQPIVFIKGVRDMSK